MQHLLSLGISGAGIAALSVDAGLRDEVRRQVRSWLDSDNTVYGADDPYVLAEEGELAISEHRRAAAVSLLAKALPRLRELGDVAAPQIADSLASVLIAEQRFDDAIGALQPLQSNHEVAPEISRLTTTLARLTLAQLYRRTGRTADAQKIEAELLHRWKYADPDFPPLLQLKRQIAQSAAPALR